MELLDLPEGFATASALSINNAGVVVGVGRGPEMRFSEALRWTEGRVERLNLGVGEGQYQAVDINDKGIIVGDAAWQAGLYRSEKWRRIVPLCLFELGQSHKQPQSSRRMGSRVLWRPSLRIGGSDSAPPG